MPEVRKISSLDFSTADHPKMSKKRVKAEMGNSNCHAQDMTKAKIKARLDVCLTYEMVKVI
jgi:hypothetical protein